MYEAHRCPDCGLPGAGGDEPTSLKEQAEPGVDPLKMERDSQTRDGKIVTVAEAPFKRDSPAHITNPLVKQIDILGSSLGFSNS